MKALVKIAIAVSLAAIFGCSGDGNPTSRIDSIEDGAPVIDNDITEGVDLDVDIEGDVEGDTDGDKEDNENVDVPDTEGAICITECTRIGYDQKTCETMCSLL